MVAAAGAGASTVMFSMGDDVQRVACAGAHPTDVRMTTRFKPGDLLEGLTGAVHETGHALYEQGRNLAYDGLPVNQVCTCMASAPHCFAGLPANQASVCMASPLQCFDGVPVSQACACMLSLLHCSDGLLSGKPVPACLSTTCASAWWACSALHSSACKRARECPSRGHVVHFCTLQTNVHLILHCTLDRSERWSSCEGAGAVLSGPKSRGDGPLLHAQALSMGVHESQSLLWERMVGLSRSFAAYLTPKLQAAFPQLPNFDVRVSCAWAPHSPASLLDGRTWNRGLLHGSARGQQEPGMLSMPLDHIRSLRRALLDAGACELRLGLQLRFCMRAVSWSEAVYCVA